MRDSVYSNNMVEHGGFSAVLHSPPMVEGTEHGVSLHLQGDWVDSSVQIPSMYI
jgi:hypothetical protein